MNSRRTFLAGLPALAVGATSVSARDVRDCADSAKTIEEIKKRVPLLSAWVEAEYVGRKLFFTLTEVPSDSASHIEIHGWTYNEQFREWRRCLKVGIRHVGKARLVYDPRGGVISVAGTADNEFNGAEVLRFDLRATSNDEA
jgi:hypothetical protein